MSTRTRASIHCSHSLCCHHCLTLPTSFGAGWRATEQGRLLGNWRGEDTQFKNEPANGFVWKKFRLGGLRSQSVEPSSPRRRMGRHCLRASVAVWPGSWCGCSCRGPAAAGTPGGWTGRAPGGKRCPSRPCHLCRSGRCRTA